MRVLLDSCVWGGATADLAGEGHDVVHASSWAEDPGDEVVLARAHEESRVLITLDKDFGELVIVRGLPHAGIVRLVGFRGTEQGRACCAVLERYRAELERGAVLTVDPKRVRVRPAE